MKHLSQKHQPKRFKILHEDRDIIVVDKDHGLLTVGTDREKMKTLHYLLNEYVKKGNDRSHNRVYVVHRLDRETSGIVVFAKSEKAKEYLQKNWQSFHKNYYAVVHGKLKKKEDLISSYLTENKAFIVYAVKDPEKGKLAKTGYTVLKENDLFSLVHITLFTGRKNQIRVHFADLGHPLVGDKVYGKDTKEFKRLALHSTSLTITHPHTHKELSFETAVPDYFKVLVKMQ